MLTRNDGSLSAVLENGTEFNLTKGTEFSLMDKTNSVHKNGSFDKFSMQASLI